MTKDMPVLFLGHGSPMNIVADNTFTKIFSALGRDLPRPRAILCISAHWLTAGTQILSSENPRQIFDFSGFPEELYKIQYSPPGAPELAENINQALIKSETSDTWGLDHGTWSILHHMYPEQNIPTFQLSLNRRLSGKEHLDLAAKLQFLRKSEVLVFGSGNLVHNLMEISWDSRGPAHSWAEDFESFAIEILGQKNISHSEKFERLLGSSLFQRAHPTPEHFLPLIYTVGLTPEGTGLELVSKGIQNASVSMTNFRA